MDTPLLFAYYVGYLAVKFVLFLIEEKKNNNLQMEYFK